MSKLRSVSKSEKILTLFHHDFSVFFNFIENSSIAALNSLTNVTSVCKEKEELGSQYFKEVLSILSKVIEKGMREPKIKSLSIKNVGDVFDDLKQKQYGLCFYGMNMIAENFNIYGYIKNYFSLNGVQLFLCQLFGDDVQKNEIIQLTDKDGVPIGLAFGYMGCNIFIPYKILFGQDTSNSNILIDSEVSAALKNTCYVYNQHSYCTGIQISQNKILTVRHIMRQNQIKLGHTLLVTMCPYNKWISGKVTKINDTLDAIEITLSNGQFQQNSISQIQTKNDYQVGEKALALGFGEVNFSKVNLDQMTILPTLSKGIISKSIQLDGFKCFIRFDGSLNRGFSGGGLWSNSSLIGMCIFNLKKLDVELPYINFSYSISLIKSQLSPKVKQFVKKVSNYNIITRSKVPLLPKL